MESVAEIRPGYCPPVPDKVEALGIPRSLVTDLVLRRLYVTGMSSLRVLGDTLKLSPIIVETVFRELREQKLIEVLGMSGEDYNFTLTIAGRTAATERFQMCQYCAAAPVSLDEYRRACKIQAARVKVDREFLQKAFSDLVVTDRLLDQIGPALIAHKSMFLYGPPGNGKTSIAERLLRVYKDAVLIPYAVEVDAQIILMYDPVVHERIECEDLTIDPRWVLCKRPLVVAGGELVTSMLELKLDEGSGIYVAPLQMKANNGVFVVDDFGRQLIAPRELLNRWIVPLDRRVDYLTLRHGVKFQIPFELMVVFSTNLNPADIADEAFLRRLQNKVHIESVAPEVFDEIFRRVSEGKDLLCESGASAYLRQLCARSGHEDLYACYPNDICSIIMAISDYERRPPYANKANIERAVNLYFAKH